MARGHTPEQVIAKVRQGQKMLNDGRPMIEVIKELQITEGERSPELEALQTQEDQANVDQRSHGRVEPTS